MPPPTALNVGRRGASIELSEACSSVGQLEARAGVGLALPPLPKNEREGGIAGCHETVMRGYHEPCVNGMRWALRAGFVTASGPAGA